MHIQSAIIGGTIMLTGLNATHLVLRAYKACLCLSSSVVKYFWTF